MDLQTLEVDAYFENHKKHIKICCWKKVSFFIFKGCFTHHITGVESFDKSIYFLL